MSSAHSKTLAAKTLPEVAHPHVAHELVPHEPPAIRNACYGKTLSTSGRPKCRVFMAFPVGETEVSGVFTEQFAVENLIILITAPLIAAFMRVVPSGSAVLEAASRSAEQVKEDSFFPRAVTEVVRVRFRERLSG